ncbi:hypothetical protein EDD86DRAFT_248779 [Gorgonomyces haynaldii]|nr:hypothetical protein EDD86DRAFT_248779 [Gorgonomyces haynaldii]
MSKTAIPTALIALALYLYVAPLSQTIDQVSRQLDNLELKDIPESKIPLNPGKHYSYDDFEEKFNVQPLHSVLWDPELEWLVDAYDPREDEFYLEDKEYHDEISDKYCSFVQSGSHEQWERDRYYVKWSSPERGYGLFTRTDIQKGDVIGLTYPSTHLPKNIKLGIDSLRIGNYMRFVNHAGDELNTEMVNTLCGRRWYILYIAHEDVHANDELFTSYGPNYFKSRGISL